MLSAIILIVFLFSNGRTASLPASPTPIIDALSKRPPFLYQLTLNDGTEKENLPKPTLREVHEICGNLIPTEDKPFAKFLVILCPNPHISPMELEILLPIPENEL